MSDAFTCKPCGEVFLDFCEQELATGGPDPQVELVARAPVLHGASEDSAAWLAGCFVAPYTVGAAAAIWGEWPRAWVEADSGALTQWLREHWAGIPMRRERRAAWQPEKLAECLHSYAMWQRLELPHLLTASYEDVWRSVTQRVRYFGRYATMKLIETLNRMGLVKVRQPDIRPRGGWSPRKMLTLLFPDRNLHKEDSAVELAKAQMVAWDARELLAGKVSVPVTWFQLETLLCNTRQALDGKYPGRSHDRELAHYLRAAEHWGHDWLRHRLNFTELRHRLFPHECLGEKQGWNGARKELERTLADHNYLWSDLKYDYSTTTDLANPVRRTA